MKELFEDGQRGENRYFAWLGITWKSKHAKDTKGTLPCLNMPYREIDHPLQALYPLSQEEFIEVQPISLKKRLYQSLSDKPKTEFEILEIFKDFEPGKVREALDQMQTEGDIFFSKNV